MLETLLQTVAQSALTRYPDAVDAEINWIQYDDEGEATKVSEGLGTPCVYIRKHRQKGGFEYLDWWMDTPCKEIAEVICKAIQDAITERDKDIPPAQKIIQNYGACEVLRDFNITVYHYQGFCAEVFTDTHKVIRTYKR